MEVRRDRGAPPSHGGPPGLRQFGSPRSSLQHAGAQHARAFRRQHVPYGIADHEAVPRWNRETLPARQKKSGSGLTW